MILVTGSTGAIGSELLRLLSQAGIPARALVRFYALQRIPAARTPK